MQHRPTNRGQAALEFLSTYGAAFLIMLIALGALSYTGLFNVASLRSDECTMAPGIECSDFTITRVAATPQLPPLNYHVGQTPALSEHVVLSLLNTYGVNLTMVNITMTVQQAPGVVSSCSYATASGFASPQWERGVQATVWCPLPPTLRGANYRANQRLDAVVRFNFTQQAGSYQYLINGDVSATTH